MKRFTVRGANHGFTCVVCGTEVRPSANGSVRNHCPACLCSLHVDDEPGDRAADCGGVLEPIAVEPGGKSGWTVVHRCRRCGALRRNRAALDDPRQPDDYAVVVRLSAQPGPTGGGPATRVR